jgi:hypothetical protein
MQRQVLPAIERAGIRPELPYAYKKTGFLLAEGDPGKLSKTQLQEWGLRRGGVFYDWERNRGLGLSSTECERSVGAVVSMTNFGKVHKNSIHRQWWCAGSKIGRN